MVSRAPRIAAAEAEVVEIASSHDKTEAAQARTGHRCVLGRETCLHGRWSGGTVGCGWRRWLSSQAALPLPKGWVSPRRESSARDDFDATQLDVRWSSLRQPVDARWLFPVRTPRLAAAAGWRFAILFVPPKLIVRRVQHFRFTAETGWNFPRHYTQMAGDLLLRHRQHYYLRVTYDDKAGKVLGIILTDAGAYMMNSLESRSL